MPRTAHFRALLLSMSVLSLAACGSSDSGSGYAKTSAPMPPVAEMDAAMAQPVPQPLQDSDTLTPILSAGAVSSPTSSVVASTEAPVVTHSVAPVVAGSVEERIAKLEQSIGSLRTDYDRIMPAFASLNTTNERIQTLLDEIERDTGKRPADTVAASVAETTVVSTTTTQPPLSAPPVALKAAPPATIKTETITTETTKIVTPADAPASAVAAIAETPAKPVVAAEAPASSATGANVTGVRIGEHGSKTRLVLDLSGKTKPEFKYDLDNGEKVLLVDLPATGWSGNASGKGGGGAPLVSGWTAQKGDNGGSTLAIQLKKNARILSTQFLPGEGKDPSRLVMDIAAGG